MSMELFITKQEFERRLESVQDLMKQRALEGLIIFSGFQEREGHVCYLTNHRNPFPNGLSHKGMGYSAFVLAAEGLGILISPFGYEANKVVNIDIVETGFSFVPNLVAAAKKKGLDGKRIGIVGMDIIPAEYYDGITGALGKATFEIANDILENIRCIKSPAEIELLRNAAKIADAALLAGMEAACEGATSHVVELATRKAALETGADFIPRIHVSIGHKIETLIWPITTKQRIEKRDFVHLKVVGWAGGYGFSNSRIKFVGKPNGDQKSFLDQVVEATEWMISLMRPRAQLGFVLSLHRDRRILPSGHGIGLEISENPWLIMGCNKVCIETNVVLCINPTVIDKKFGGMYIEDTVLVTGTGVEVLNQCPRVL